MHCTLPAGVMEAAARRSLGGLTPAPPAQVIDRILFKLDELVRPYVHKILVVIEPLLIDEDYYARWGVAIMELPLCQLEGRE